MTVTVGSGMLLSQLNDVLAHNQLALST